MAIDLEVKTDLTDSTNEIIKNTLSKPTKETGETLSTLISFFNNTVLYPLRKYNLYAEDKLKKYANELETKVKSISEENFVEPSVNIVGPTMEGLKYNLDEEHIKEMFLNILISDMNKTKKKNVLPSYIDIVKQLSNEDAKLLQSLSETNLKDFSVDIIVAKPRIQTSGYVVIDKVIVVNENRTITPRQVVLDNLIRLGILNYYDNKSIAASQLYEIGFNLIKHHYKDIESNVTSLSYDKAVLQITDYGMNFINICFNK